MTPAVEARALHRTYSLRRGVSGRKAVVHAVSGVSFQIERGAILGIVGESGCGKSTLARLLLGIEPPSSGQVLIDGQPVTEMHRRQRARKIQIVFQDPNSSLNPRKNIRSILTMPLEIHSDGQRHERQRRVEGMMERVGLPRRLLSSRPGDLSGGQRQRVAIARALIMQPEILICDEPTSALDVSVQSQILNLLQDLREEFDLTYIMISHNLAVIEHMATRVAVMYLGRIVEDNETAEVFARPRHPYTQALLESVLTPEPDKDVPKPELGVSYPNPLNPPSGCRFHPRCPEVMQVCSLEAPPIVDAAGGMVECHLYGDRSAENQEGEKQGNG